MKYFILQVLFLFASNCLVAQSTPKAFVEWGPKKAFNNKLEEKFIKTDGEYTYVFWYTAQGFQLQKLDRKMKVVQKSRFNASHRGNRTSLNYSVLYGGKIHVFSSFYNRKTHRNHLFHQAIDPSSFKETVPLQLIGSIITKRESLWITTEEFADDDITGYFQFRLSPDRNKLLILFANPYSKTGSESFTYQVYNRNFEKEWEKKVALPYLDKNFKIEGFRVDNQGNVHLIGWERVYDEFNKRKKGVSLLRFFSWFPNTAFSTNHIIELSNIKQIESMIYLMDENDKLICAGFFKYPNLKGVRGSFYLRIDPATGDVIEKSVDSFDSEIFKKPLTKFQKERDDQGELDYGDWFDYELDELVIREDGRILLVGEKRDYYQDYEVMTDGMLTMEYDNYQYDDILLVSLSPSGKLEWSTRVPKSQYSIDDNGMRSSYHLKVTKDHLYLFFYDEDKNFNRSSEDLVGKSAYESLAVVQVNDSGHFEKHKLISKSDIQLKLIPKYFWDRNEKEVLLYGYRRPYLIFRRSRYQFSRLVFY